SLNLFFQAEDGIRDFHVTGVQTCALPIWRQQHWQQQTLQRSWLQESVRSLTNGVEGPLAEGHFFNGDEQGFTGLALHGLSYAGRSEERRVGSEGGKGWRPYSRRKQTYV